MKPVILIAGRGFAGCMPRGIEQMTTVRDVEALTDRLARLREKAHVTGSS